MDEIRVGYFLEDIGHEGFLRSLVVRVARERGLAPQTIHADVRNATGGRGKVLEELQRFLRDVRREREHPFDLMIVAIDGNCLGYRARRDEILDIVRRSGYPGPTICAVPDPHIERWYLADPHGFQQALGVGVIPDVPAYKCERGRYKRALREAVRKAGVIAPLGGLEYGSDIAESLEIYVVGRMDAGFRHFIEELQAGLAPFVISQREQK